MADTIIDRISKNLNSRDLASDIFQTICNSLNSDEIITKEGLVIVHPSSVTCKREQDEDGNLKMRQWFEDPKFARPFAPCNCPKCSKSLDLT